MATRARRGSALAAACVAVLLLAACGGGSDEAPAAGESTEGQSSTGREGLREGCRAVDEEVGGEGAARESLARGGGDPRATEVLITLLERDPRRLEELIETQRRAAAAVASVFGRTSEARTQLPRLAQTL